MRSRNSALATASLTLLCISAPQAKAQTGVRAWGGNTYGQCNVPALPTGIDYVQVSAGGDHTVAIEIHAVQLARALPGAERKGS